MPMSESMYEAGERARKIGCLCELCNNAGRSEEYGEISMGNLVWSKNSTPAVEIQGNAAAQLPETGLKQVLCGMGTLRKVCKWLI